MGRLLLVTAACAVITTFGALHTASAVPVTVSYSIDSGSFSGPVASGRVTGGSVTVRFPDAVSLHAASIGPATWLNLTLTGPSGFFRLQNAIGVSYGVMTPVGETAALSTFYFRPPYPMIVSAPSIPLFTPVPAFSFDLIAARGYVVAYGLAPFASRTMGGGLFSALISNGIGSTSLSHYFSIGSEISRVPEPASGTLVLLGLAGLATLPGARRLLHRR